MAKKVMKPEKPFVPLHERPGRCGNPTCGGASFKSAIYKHDILRCCKNCGEIYNIDKEKVIRKGEIQNENE